MATRSGADSTLPGSPAGWRAGPRGRRRRSSVTPSSLHSQLSIRQWPGWPGARTTLPGASAGSSSASRHDRLSPRGSSAPGGGIDQRARIARRKRAGQVDRIGLARLRPPVRPLGSGQKIALRIVIAQAAGYCPAGRCARVAGAIGPAEAFAVGRGGRQGEQWRRFGGCVGGKDRQRTTPCVQRQGPGGMEHGQHVHQPPAFQREALQSAQQALAGHGLVERGEQVHQRHFTLIGKDLEGQGGDAIAEIGQLQILEHDIGHVAEGRAIGAPVGGDQRIDRLVAMAAIEPQRAARLQIARRAAQQVTVRPDAPHIADRPAGQRHREGGGIGKTGEARPALAAAGFTAFGKLGRPDDRSGTAHSPVLARDRRAIGGSGDREVLQARAFTAGRSDQRVVHLLAHQRADRAAECPAH